MIAPFPLARRVGLVRKQAAWFLAQDSLRGAEANLRRLLEIQRQALRARGIDVATVDSEVRTLEEAIRAQVRRLAYGEAG